MPIAQQRAERALDLTAATGKLGGEEVVCTLYPVPLQNSSQVL
jgi:hypothetical protein